MSNSFQTLPGFRDFYPDDCAARNYVFDVWRSVARRYGFVEYDGPILEGTELYTRKSGEEIVKQLFNFTDKGEREVAMRPELTPTLARMAAARQRDFKKPMRWFSIGQFFRYEKPQKGRGREFYQFNCDILGESAAAADAELAALAVDVMREFGFNASQCRLRVSDRGAWTNFATRAGVAEADLGAFLQTIDKMERSQPEEFAKNLKPYGLMPQEIEQFIAAGAESSAALSTLKSDLSARGMGDFVEIDLRVVRGLAYYTGVVFEIFDIGKGMRALAGGGRYDQLLRLIGGVDMPACGFAMGDMVVTNLIRESEGPSEKLCRGMASAQSTDIFVIIADEGRRPEGIAVTQRLRDAGYRTVFSMTPAKMAKQFQAAEQSGARFAVIIGAELPRVSLKDLGQRSETSHDEKELLSVLGKVYPR